MSTVALPLEPALIVRRPIAIENDRLLARDAVRGDTVGRADQRVDPCGGSTAWNSVVVRLAQRRPLVDVQLCPPPVGGYVVLFAPPSVTAFVAPPPEISGTHIKLTVVVLELAVEVQSPYDPSFGFDVVGPPAGFQGPGPEV